MDRPVQASRDLASRLSRGAGLLPTDVLATPVRLRRRCGGPVQRIRHDRTDCHQMPGWHFPPAYHRPLDRVVWLRVGFHCVGGRQYLSGSDSHRSNEIRPRLAPEVRVHAGCVTH